MDDPLGAQILIDDVWTPVSVLVEDGCTITGGRRKDAQAADPMSGRVTLRNNDGKLSSRNPRSPLFGKLGRATPARLIAPADTHLWLAENASCAYAGDLPSLDITGDIDLRADIQPTTWTLASGFAIAGKYVTTGNQRSWAFYVDPAGKLALRWSTDGTAATIITARSTLPVPAPGDGRISVRVTLDVNNGGGGWTATFYTSTATGVAGPWTQLGTPVTLAGTTSIFNSTSQVTVGGRIGVTLTESANRIYAFQVRNGIGGTVVGNPDFTAQPAGTAPFLDSAAVGWLFVEDTEIRDFDVRMSGEIADWPVDWVTSGRKITAPVEVSGWLRRLNQPGNKIRSPMFREATSALNLSKMVAYWPLEDGSDATQGGSGIGGTPMKPIGTTAPSWAGSTRFPGSDPLVTINTGSSLQGTIPAYTATGSIFLRMLVDFPNFGWSDGTTLVEIVATSGTVRYWLLQMSALGALRVQALSVTRDVIATGTWYAFDIENSRRFIGLDLFQSGSDATAQIVSRKINDDLTVAAPLFGTEVFTSQTVGRAATVTIAPSITLDGFSVGHVMVGRSQTLATGIDNAIVGNFGETAGERLVRLAAEFGIPLRVVGDPSLTDSMGPQKSGTKLDALQACEAADRGILAEARETMSLVYRPRFTLYNQTARAVLANGSTGESPDLHPDEPLDDVVNLYTAKRDGGSEFVARKTDGRLSTNDWPAGVGEREGGDTLNVASDSVLPDVAWWEIHLGTWDEYRHPKVKINLSKLVDAGKGRLAAAVASAMPGDDLMVTNPPSWLPPDPIDMLAQGWEETIKPGRRFITFNTSPGRPWRVGVVGVDLVESDGTTLVSGLTAVPPGTSQAVAVNVVGTPWSTAAATPFVMQLLKNGLLAERVTVTAISGATSPQTFTLTRGLDGYTIAHDAAAALTLYQPLRWAR